MKIQIIHPNPEIVQQTLNNVLNIACITALGGFIPTERDQANPELTGTYWYREDDKIHLAGINNDFWGYITDETETSVTLEFRYRRNHLFGDLLCQMLVGRFTDVKLLNLD